MEEADFGIVIPAYNAPDLLRRALDSVRSQRDITWEAIVVDDSNNTSEIEDYVTGLNDPRISYHHNQPSLGAVPNWNQGLKLVGGRHIILLHHDECLQGNHYLHTMLQQLEHHDIAAARVVVYRSDGKVYETAPAWVKKVVLCCPSLLFAINPIGPSAAFAFRRENLQLFDEQTRWFVDVEWYYRMLRSGKACYVPTAAIESHHGHQGQISANIDTVAEARKDAAVLKSKYRRNLPVRLTMWVFIHVIHNHSVNNAIKHLLRR